ncbi:putative proline oxidase [Schistosoma mansoni]|uniref:putative proline oxidase n=1 Tax=Schistosoma mansoni TaxID=6183 RepID=UPI00022DC383|nr:putative proline oxidase [Schistosoma mansoni]|eukprot:XP_018652488.1 putative proline oxidase [Schistosoma mansoni]
MLSSLSGKQNIAVTSLDEPTNSCNTQNFSFRDSKLAHAAKSNSEVIRALLVFKICSFPTLVKHNKKLMDVSRKIFGKSLFRLIMKMTFYGHFVAGENEASIQPLIMRLKKYGVKSILDYSVEKDIQEDEAVQIVKKSLSEVLQTPEKRPEAATKQYQISIRFADRTKQVVGARSYFYKSEYQCDRNMETFMKCIDVSSKYGEDRGFTAIKLTALGRPQLLQQMSDFLVQMKRLFFLLTKADNGQKGGLVSLDLDNFRKKLEGLGIKIAYDENVKWFTLLDVSGDGVLDLLDWSHLKAFEYDLASLFILKNKKTGEVEQLVPTLTIEGIEEMRNMIKRVDTLASYAKSVGVRVMVDAEQSYFQPAIRRLIIEMMRLFNKDKAVIFGTYQCYLKEALESLTQDLNHAATENFYFGAKLVRGAYMDQVNVHQFFQPFFMFTFSTCHHCCVYTEFEIHCMVEMSSCTGSWMRTAGKSHNRTSWPPSVSRMHEYDISPKDRLICFGQLLGMCDQISFTLSQAGYSVYKYVPYGPVEEVLPYLSRRALENGSVLNCTLTERQLLWSELKRRLSNGQFIYKP